MLTTQPLEHVAVKVGGVISSIQIADVDWLETDRNYLRLHIGDSSYPIRATAASIEPQLDPRQFIRIHRRFIVNVDRVAGVEPSISGDATVVLRNGTRLRLARTHRHDFNARFGKGWATTATPG